MRCAAPVRAHVGQVAGVAQYGVTQPMCMAFVLPQYTMPYGLYPGSVMPFARSMSAPTPPVSPMPTPPTSPAPTPPGSPTNCTAPVWGEERAAKSKKRSRPAPPARAWETTVLLRDIPRELAPSDVLECLREYRSVIDFLYVPIKFETRQNLGYAFVNFSDKAAVPRLAGDLARLLGEEAFVQPAKITGLEANVERFRNASVMAVLPEDCKPMLFQRGRQVPFPKPTKKLPPIGPRFRPAIE